MKAKLRNPVMAGVGVILAGLAAACNVGPTATATAPAVLTQVQPEATQSAASTVPPSSTPEPLATSAPTEAPPTATVAAAPTVVKLNLNTASPEAFLTVPGVGNRMVREFEEYRPYTSILQFRREIGKYVETAQVAAYEQYVFVPVDVNAADAETLKQLPGVDDAIAAELIVGRPYADDAAFLAALEQLTSVEQAAVAAIYLTTP